MKPWAYGAALAGLAAAGCATAPQPRSKPAAPGAALPVVLAKFERRLADGRLSIAANLKNASPAPERAQVTCAFDDGQGRPVSPEPAPAAVALEPGEILTVRFDAPSVAALEGIVSVGP